MAVKSLQDELTLIHQENPIAAQEITLRIFTKIDLLKDNPFLGPQYRLKGVRKLSLSNYPYSIYYRPRKPWIEILQVRHEARMPLNNLH